MRASRYSIAGLMGIILVASLGFAALSRPSETASGITVLVTVGILTLAIVGTVCGGTKTRAWWLGFALFGWGYWKLAWPEYQIPRLPTLTLLETLMSKVATPVPQEKFGDRDLAVAFRDTANCLWALVFASLGGGLAHWLFASNRRTEPPDPVSTQAAIPKARAGKSWHRVFVFSVAAISVIAVLFWGTPRYPALFGGATLLLTWMLVGVAILGAIYSTGLCRARWLGAALFGAGYLLLTFDLSSESDYSPTWSHRAIDNAIRWLWPAIVPREVVTPPSSPQISAANERIRKKLELPVPMEFPGETPLEEVLKHIKTATEENGDAGLPIYVDVIGLQEAEKSLQSTVRIEVTGVPLKRTLDVLLHPIGLTYEIDEGLLKITSQSTDDRPMVEDPIMPVCHCLLALVVAGIGALVAPMVARHSFTLDLSERPVINPAASSTRDAEAREKQEEQPR